MFIKFKELTRVNAVLDICCFSGKGKHQTWEFDKDEEFEVKSIAYGKTKKLKSDLGIIGVQMCTLYLTGKDENIERLDYLYDVPSDVFEIMPLKCKRSSHLCENKN